MADRPQLVFVNFKKDAYIILEGKQTGSRFFIIREGKVRVSKEAEVIKEAEGDILGPGDFFGVVSVMSDYGQIETVQAVTDVALISVHKSQFVGLIQHNTPIAMKIILQFSRRMRYLDHALAKMTLKGESTEEDASLLWTIGQFYDKQMRRPQAFYVYHQYVKYCPAGENRVMVQERLRKLAPYAAKVRFDYNATELNRNYKKDDILFAEGESGDELFIIRAGSVKITKYMNSNEVLLAVLKSGDIFGEMALLESKPRSASAIAFEDCQVMVVTRANFQGMTASQPQIVGRLTQLLAERIWFIYKQLANVLLENPVERVYDALLMQLEKNRIPIEKKSSCTFNFGPREFATMVGISQVDIGIVLQKLMHENTAHSVQIDATTEKIKVTDALDILNQCTFYRNSRKREATRREAARKINSAAR
jgi:CRP-like cAMP-binding protein